MGGLREIRSHPLATFLLTTPSLELRHESIGVKLMQNSEQWSLDSVQPCPLLENAVLCSWAHLVVLLSLPLRSSPRRYSGSQTDRRPLVLPTSPAKVTPIAGAAFWPSAQASHHGDFSCSRAGL